MIRLLAALWLALLVIAAPAAAQTFPKLSGRVVDNANLLDPQQETQLTGRLAALETQTGRQFVIATVPSLEGRTIEDYGYRLGREWAIGDKERDDGTILLVAPKEKKVRIETGYGARVFLTDAVSSVIIRNSILPKFKAGDFPGGIIDGAGAIIKTLELSPAEAARRAKEVGAAESRRGSDGFNPMPVFVVMALAFLVLSSIRKRAGGRRYKSKRRGGGIDPMVVLWGLEVLSHVVDKGGRGGGWGGGGGGGFGGGGFSGGGGSFGGGGASGGW